jgi:hypothetical protein
MLVRDFVLPSGNVITLESDDGAVQDVKQVVPEPDGFAPAGPGKRAVGELLDFSKSLEPLKEAAAAIAATFQQQKPKPAEMTVTLGVKVSLSGNVVVATATGEGHFSVTLKYAF